MSPKRAVFLDSFGDCDKWSVDRNMSKVTPSVPGGDTSDTPFSDSLLDQFAAYYLLSVLAVKLLEEARRQRAMATQSTARPVQGA